MFRVTWSRKCWRKIELERLAVKTLSLFSMSAATAFEELCSLSREAALVESVEAMLGWDERTYMPPAAGEYRAEQMTYLSGLVHKQRTSKRLGELLGELTASS